MSATALRAPDRPSTAAPVDSPAKALVGAGLLIALAVTLGVGIIAAILGQTSTGCQAPAAGAATSLPAPGTGGQTLRGRVS